MAHSHLVWKMIEKFRKIPHGNTNHLVLILYVVAFLAGTLSYSTREIQYPA
jgi:hypothetical protein